MFKRDRKIRNADSGIIQVEVVVNIKDNQLAEGKTREIEEVKKEDNQDNAVS